MTNFKKLSLCISLFACNFVNASQQQKKETFEKTMQKRCDKMQQDCGELDQRFDRSQKDITTLKVDFEKNASDIDNLQSWQAEQEVINKRFEEQFQELEKVSREPLIIKQIELQSKS